MHHPAASLPDRPVFRGDPLNLFVVFASGSERVEILDGDAIEAIHGFALRGEPACPPQFSPDGRYAYIATRDGWISKFDLWRLKAVAEARAGLEMRSLAIASDGSLLAAGIAAPHALALLDADLNPVKMIAAADAAREHGSAVTALADAPARRSFVAALPGAKEIWEISYDRAAPEIAQGLVHDYQLREGAFIAGFLNPRRTPLEDAIEDFRLAPDGRQLVGAARDGAALQVVHLDVRRSIARIALPGGALPSAGAFWVVDGRTLFAVPGLREGGLWVIDSSGWKTVKRIETRDRGLVLSSHSAGRYAYLAASPGAPYGAPLQVVDPRRLELVDRPSPHATGPLELDRAGRYVLATLPGDGGALVAYDASTLRELKRLSLQRPVGKYNVFNRIRNHPGFALQP